MSAGHNPGSGKYWIGLGDTDTKFPRGSYRIAPADPNHLINRDWIGKTIRSRYTVLGDISIRSPINTDPGIGSVTSLFPLWLFFVIIRVT
ncbi:hypothetical protein PGT21_031627 [Puccinia graminis f. sp. tritici]|uniref:Uncharacterized protein n=1 Tax=Puccinia graminis f. sp. tritici TaxID=56615 RepID=A0A5B0MSF1_PUCGR|nr:hypothetical protein PGTUg99_008590 [Puccinia graminis f. sp. tritici]KAA1094863.1 hypothetical protein PGT21_031627 [Puccinia graminis f. sp. tritici]